MAKKVLGKGLGAIISASSKPVDEIDNAAAASGESIVELDIKSIQPNPDQPREHFDEYEIQGLAESIKSVGILQPILVRKAENGYRIIAGERRFRASILAGLKTIKSVVMEATDEENLTLALIENIQRTNLDPIEEAKSYKMLISRFKLKQQDVASRVGKDRATISNLMRLLNLPDRIKKAVSGGIISVGHAKVLLSVPEQEQDELFDEIIKKDLSVRALEKLHNESGSSSREKSLIKKGISEKNAHIRKMEDMLTSMLGTKVEIKHSGSRGKIEISYYSLEDFDRIIEILR